MTEIETTSPRESQASNSGERGAAANASANIHDRTGLYISIIALILSAIALGFTLMNPQLIAARMDAMNERTTLAEREARVMQERWNDLKVELARRGIPVSDH